MKQKGFTLIELMIVVVIILIAGTFVVSLVGGTTNTFSKSAEENARKHVNTLYPDWTNVRISCMNMDSDQDGYVRCTVAGKDEENASVTETLECGYLVSNGCASFKPAIVVHNR